MTLAAALRGVFRPPIRPGARPSASSGTTKARGSTTRATRRSSARGGRTSGTRSTSRRCSPGSNTPPSRRSASACGRRGSCPSWRASLSVLLLALGVRRIAGDAPALIAGALLATNYVYVMYDRAAIMEALMVAFIVASWYCSTRARTDAARGARWRGRLRAAGVFHQGGGGVLSSARWAGCDRARRLARARVGAAITPELGDAPRPRRGRSAGSPLAAAARRGVSSSLPHWTRLPVLQLADVGDAQAVVRPARRLSCA